jgi:hypothetical protein
VSQRLTGVTERPAAPVLGSTASILQRGNLLGTMLARGIPATIVQDQTQHGPRTSDYRMTRRYYDSFSLLPDGRYRVVRTAHSGDVSAPLLLDRTGLEHYLKNVAVVGSTLQAILLELDEAGYAEATVRN